MTEGDQACLNPNVSRFNSASSCPIAAMPTASVALPVVGTADQVAEQLARLYELGMDGVLIEFLHYYDDTVRFGKEIVPLLRQMGVVA